QQIRNFCREDSRFLCALIEIGNEIYGFLFDVGEQLLGNFGEARFGVTHGRRWIAVHRAEVSLAVDERVAHVEALREPDEGVIHRRVAVRMELAENFADDLGAFAVRLRGSEAEFVHAEENAAMYWLQSVAHVGERAANDYAHGVIEVRLLHFGFDIYGGENWLFWIVSHFCRL